MGQLVLFLFVVLSFSASTAIAEDSSRAPNLDGYVTRVISAQDFDVNATRVLTSSKTRYVVGTSTIASPNFAYTPRFGQSAKIFGNLDKKHQTVTATEIRFGAPPPDDNVSGLAIIDLIPKHDHSNPHQLLVRADGYLILISPDTSFRSNLPDQSLAAIHTNVWIDYHGRRQPDGTILADKASFIDNKIAHSARRQATSQNLNYDPEKIGPDAHQSGVRKAFLGQDPKKIPPYKDASMQARVDRIGSSLIPAYQKALPESDPTKIIFRFELVDQKKVARCENSPQWHHPPALSDRRTAQRRHSTSYSPRRQHRVCAREARLPRQQPTQQKMTALSRNLVGQAGTVIVPGPVLAH